MIFCDLYNILSLGNTGIDSNTNRCHLDIVRKLVSHYLMLPFQKSNLTKYCQQRHCSFSS